jgi:hypothetical protein
VRRPLILVVLSVLLVAATPAPPAEGPWGELADAALHRAQDLDTGAGNAFNYAWLASAVAHRSRQGWNDPQARAYLNTVLALRNGSGGWGLTQPWDAFADGTINPATTTYTITLTEHVGAVLLEAYQAGAVDRSVITSLMDKLYTIPRIPVNFGYCYAYSAHSNDVKPGYCVHNVNAAVALFLRRAELAGIYYGGDSQQWWQVNITRQEVYTYLPHDRSWRYMDGRHGLNDPAHNALGIDAMLVHAPGIGREALEHTLSRPADTPIGWFGPLALARHDCNRAAQWADDITTAMSDPSVRSFGLQVQAARLAALAADACPT